MSSLDALKGVAVSIPNQTVLINSLGLQESKDSSTIENIVPPTSSSFKGSSSIRRVAITP